VAESSSTNVVTFAEKRPALALSDYLREQGIPNRVEATEHGFAIMLDRPEQASQAVAEVQSFAAHPDDPKYWQSSWQTGTVEKQPVYGGSEGIVAWWRRAGVVTRSVALLCVVVFLLEMGLGERETISWLSYPEGISLAAIGNEWWRLLTPAFLHFSVLHIAFNLLWWWELGGIIERMQSGWRLLALTLVIALVSNAAQFLSYGSNFGGLSAVVYGLLGYLWLYPFADPTAPFRLRGVIVAFMVGWLALGYTGIFNPIFGAISNNGHLSGLLTGAALGGLLGLVNYRRPDTQGR
jgi:GlpG protein